MKISTIAVIVGIVLGNYLYQLIGDGDWVKATDRTYFQLLAILLYWFFSARKQGNK